MNDFFNVETVEGDQTERIIEKICQLSKYESLDSLVN